MSDELFVEWLRDSGMTQSGDRDKIIGINKSRIVNYNSDSSSCTGRPVLRYRFIGKAAFCHAFLPNKPLFTTYCRAHSSSYFISVVVGLQDCGQLFEG